MMVFAGLDVKDAEWMEHIGDMTKDDLLKLGKEFAAKTVDKLQHGTCSRVLCWQLHMG